MRSQVGIIGAGPAGLMLSHLLHLAGIESIVVENRSRDYVEGRIRAGVIEHWAADLLVDTGVGARMQREGLVHGGIHLSFNDELRLVDFNDLVGQGILVYGQHEVVKDLIARRLADGGQILFDVDNVSVEALTNNRPKIRFRQGGAARSSIVTSSAAVTAFMASPGRACRTACSPPTSANIRSGGSASWRRRNRCRRS